MRGVPAAAAEWRTLKGGVRWRDEGTLLDRITVPHPLRHNFTKQPPVDAGPGDMKHAFSSPELVARPRPWRPLRQLSGYGSRAVFSFDPELVARPPPWRPLPAP